MTVMVSYTDIGLTPSRRVLANRLPFGNASWKLYRIYWDLSNFSKIPRPLHQPRFLCRRHHSPAFAISLPMKINMRCADSASGR